MTRLMMDNRELDSAVPGLVRKMILFFSGEKVQQSEKGLSRGRQSKEQQEKGQGKDQPDDLHQRNDVHCKADPFNGHQGQGHENVGHQSDCQQLNNNTTIETLKSCSLNGFTVANTERSRTNTTSVTVDSVANQSVSSVQNVTITNKSPSYIGVSCSVGGYPRYKRRACNVLTCSDGAKDLTDGVDSGLGSSASMAHSSGDELNDCQVPSSRSSTKDVCTSIETVLDEVPDERHSSSVSGVVRISTSDNRVQSHDSRPAEIKLDSTELQNEQASVTPVTSPEADKTSGDVTCDDGTVTSQKDGRFYLNVLNETTERLQTLCQQAEADLDRDLPDEICGKIRATVGKANLLISKKFKQFRELCDMNLTQSGEEAFQTTSQDLAGFWDMVEIQVADVDAMFDDLQRLRQNGWKNDKPSQQKEPNGSGESRPVTHTRSRTPHKSPTTTKTQQSSTDSAKARRELMRKKLKEAKAAGRQKRHSSSDNDDEIFVSIYT